MDATQLQALPRKQLQEIAKRENIKANAKSETIIKQLLKKHPAGVPLLGKIKPSSPPYIRPLTIRIKPRWNHASTSRTTHDSRALLYADSIGAEVAPEGQHNRSVAPPSPEVERPVVRGPSTPKRFELREDLLENDVKEPSKIKVSGWIKSLAGQQAEEVASPPEWYRTGSEEPQSPPAQIHPLGVECDENEEHPTANQTTQRAPSPSQSTERVETPKPRRRRSSRPLPVSQIRRQALLATSTYHSSEFDSSQVARWRRAPSHVEPEPSWPSIPTRGSSRTPPPPEIKQESKSLSRVPTPVQNKGSPSSPLRTPSPFPQIDREPSLPSISSRRSLRTPSPRDSTFADDNSVVWRDGRPYRQSTHLPRGATEREALRIAGDLKAFVVESASLDKQFKEVELLIDGTCVESRELEKGLTRVAGRRVGIERAFMQRMKETQRKGSDDTDTLLEERPGEEAATASTSVTLPTFDVEERVKAVYAAPSGTQRGTKRSLSPDSDADSNVRPNKRRRLDKGKAVAR